MVSSLRESGLSLRAISAATGNSLGTVHTALSGVQNRTPDPDCDGKCATDECVCPTEDDANGIAERLIVPEQHLPPLPENYMPNVNPTPAGTVTGIDGKKYPKPTTTIASMPTYAGMRHMLCSRHMLSPLVFRISCVSFSA